MTMYPGGASLQQQAYLQQQQQRMPSLGSMGGALSGLNIATTTTGSSIDTSATITITETDGARLHFDPPSLASPEPEELPFKEELEKEVSEWLDDAFD